LVTNTTTTALLNTEAGCSGTFIEGSAETLPPGASFMVVNTNICAGALDWSGLCGAGPIYVIYSNDASWGSGGNFLNSSPGIRYFDISTTTTDASTNTFNYDWDSADLPLGDDGDYAVFGPNNGTASDYGNNGCTIDPVVLSSDVVNFIGKSANKEVILKWHSSSELNNDFYTIYHSIDGYEWNNIGNTPGHETTQSESYYGMVHDRPQAGLNYYQLHSTDFDRTTYTKSTIVVKTDISFAFYNILNNTIELENETDLEIYSTDGRLVCKNLEAKNVQIETKGMFILIDLKTNQTERIMIH